MKNTLIIMSLLSILFGTTQSDSIQVLDPVSYKNAVLGKNVQLVDVRTPQEYQIGHIDDAVNIDFNSRNFESAFENFKKDQPLYIYCRSGSRSRMASYKLLEMGFTKIYDLQGGILAYSGL